MATPGSSRLSVEHVLLVGILGVSGGGTWVGNGRLAEELRETREVIAKMAASIEIAVSKLAEHDRRLETIEARLREK